MNRSELRDLIAKDKMKTLIKCLVEIAPSQSDEWQDQLTLITSRHRHMKNRTGAGIDAHEDQMVGAAQVKKAFMELLDELPEEIEVKGAKVSKDLVKWIVGVLGLVMLVFIISQFSGIRGSSESGDVVIQNGGQNNSAKVQNKDAWEELPIDSLYKKDSIQSQD
ncbi:MAG: hypothetical protein AAF587_39985 [Bacteroidota bacterium]